MKIITGSKSMRYAGHYNLHKPVIRIHPKLKGKDRKLVLHHEKVERNLRIKHKLTYKQAHKIATQSEKKYAKKLRVNWKKYGQRINTLYSRRHK